MRLIDADALKENYNVPDAECVFSYCDTIMQVIDGQPTIEPEVRHGRWIYSGYDEYPTCSYCKQSDTYAGDYCGNCGTKMDGGAKK